MNFQSLKDFLDGYLPLLGIPGSDIAIYKDHEEIFRHQSGFDSLTERTPVRPDALYNLYSCTKVATCVAATQLIERGEILASDPVYAYFPEFRNIKVRSKDAKGRESILPAKNVLKIEHLLNMTGGLDYNIDRPAIHRVVKETDGRAPTLEIVRALAEDPFDFEPGTRYQYSFCLDVIGGLIELVSGMSLGEYMKENIFDPLGMKDTSFHLTDDRRARLAVQYNYDPATNSAKEIPKDYNWLRFGSEYESGGAGLISSVDDQILLADALAHYGVGKNGNRILTRAGIDIMRTNHLSPEQTAVFSSDDHFRGYGYGYGVRTNLTPTLAGNLSPVGEFGWDGAKGSYFSADPENGVAIFYAEHMGGVGRIVQPRLRNIIYSCLGYGD